jgi:hypothetical protein
MRMLKTGAVLVSIWAGLNLLLALGIVISMAFLGRHPPSLALFVDPATVRQIHPQVISLIDALGMFANACAAAFCALALVIVWKEVVAGARWGLTAISVVAGFLQACGFVSDGYLGHRNLAANVGSALLLAVGLALCAAGRRTMH